MRNGRQPRRGFEAVVRLYVEPMDSVVVEVAADGRVRFEASD